VIRCALRLCAGIVILACISCAPAGTAPPPAPAAVPPAPLPPAPFTAAACASLPGVGMIPASFDPSSSNGTPVATGAPVPPTILTDLQAAFTAAPQAFRDRLCGLDGIFITPAAQSWGYRNYQDGKRYIALSMSLWSGDPAHGYTAISLDQFENRVFGPPLNWPASDPTPPVYLPATPNTGAMTILTALSHEFGHVLWADVLVFPPGSGAAPSSRFCNKILSDAWTNGPQPGVWKYFEAPDTNPADIPDDPSDPPGSDPGAAEAKVQKMIAALGVNINKAHKILGRILALGRPFPSLLGAFSANEQFVESFTLYTQSRATPALTSLPLQVSPGNIRDVPATLNSRRRLVKVMSCFDSLPVTARQR
jgi:hypothetical protein